MDELNDIVFSKTFQPPSAWADRERKYKMEKRDWETDVRAPPQPAPPHHSAECHTSSSHLTLRTVAFSAGVQACTSLENWYTLFLNLCEMY